MKNLFTIILMAAMSISFFSCRESTEQKTEDAVEAIGKDIEDNTRKAGKKIEEGAQNVKREVQEEINNTDDGN